MKFNPGSFTIYILTLLICGGSYAQILPRTIAPNLTDSTIDTFTSSGYEHYVYLSESVPKRNQLFVFLPGTSGKGGGASTFNVTAAESGYHVINLIYPNNILIHRICHSSPDEACFDKAREEIVSGTDLSEALNVTKSNSIENRLIKLLQYLHKNYPAENWQQFFSKNEILWDRIAIGGQSQGGGHACYIAMKYKVARVLMFSSPKDYGGAYRKPARWIFSKSNTPVNRYFAFVHRNDNLGCTFKEQVEIFRTMGLVRPLTDVDKESFPFGNSHMLIAIKPATNPHGAPVNDYASYKHVWRYMLLREVE